MNIRTMSKYILVGPILMVGFNNCSKVAATAVTESPSLLGQGSDGFSKSTSSIIRPNDGRVDITLVVDNSGSMKQDSLNLASRLDGFVAELEASAIDWQMCLTTTNLQADKGQALNWDNNPGGMPHLLKKGTANLAMIFTDTISTMSFGGGTTGDERGIAALYTHIEKRSQHNCYRQNAAVATIVISDEDERSVGGNRNLEPNQYKVLEAIDQPNNLVEFAKQSLGSNANPLRMISNSVILKSNDPNCQATQNAQTDENGRITKGFPGLKYEELSAKTNGKVGSICDPDYTATLKDFASQIKKSLVSVALECPPLNGFVQVSFVPAMDLKYHLENQSLVIDSEISQEVSVQANYECN